MSSGTVYSLLYALERKGLIEGAWKERKRAYSLTDKGKGTIETILTVEGPAKQLMKSLLVT